MALKLNCLIKDTSLKNDIKEFVNELVSEKIAENKSANISGLYSEVRSLGVEIDAESLASIYNELYYNVNDSRISNSDELIKFSEIEFANNSRRIGNSLKGEVPKDKESTTGRLDAVGNAESTIMKLFDEKYYPQGSINVSVMKQISDTFNKLINSKLEKNKKQSKGVYEAINQFFLLEQIQNYPVVDADGNITSFKNIKDGFNELQSRIRLVVDEIAMREGLDDTQKQILQEQYDTYTQRLQDATYDIILSSGEQQELLRNLLNQNGLIIDGKGVKNFNNNINWDTLAGEYGEPKLVTAKILELLKKGVTDKNGNLVKYSEEDAQRIADYFENLYTQKRNDVIAQKASVANRPARDTISSIISDFIKSTGNIKVSRNQDDLLKRVVTDWGGVINKIKNKEISLLDLEDNLRDYLDKKYGSELTEGQKDLLVNELRKLVFAKFKGKAEKAKAIDKLMALTELNNGIAYNEQTSSTILDILEVNELQQEDIDLIREGVEVAKGINLTNPYAPVNGIAIQTIQRNLKQIATNSVKRGSTPQRVVRVINAYLNTIMQSILQNSFNIAQNIISGFPNSMVNSLLLFREYGTNAIPTFVNSQKAFINGFVSQVLGGIESVTLQDSVLGHELPSGEQYRIRQWLNLFKEGGIANVVEGVATTPVVAINTISRILLNSFDAGFMQSNIAKGALLTTYELLEREGLSKSQINDIILDYNKALKDSDYKKQISDAVNEQIKMMQSLGIVVNTGEKMLMKRDMEFSLLAEVLANNGTISVSNVKEVVSAIYDSATASAMIQFGKKRMKATSVLNIASTASYGLADASTSVQRQLFQNAEDSKSNGNYTKASIELMAGTVAQSTIGAFANGMANWFVLSLQWTPYGLIEGAGLYSSAKRYRDKYDLESQSIDGIDKEVMKKDLEFQQNQLHAITKSIIGTTAMAVFMIAQAFEDDDEKYWYNEMMDTMMKSKTTRKVLNYFSPIWLSAYKTLEYSGVDYSNERSGYKYDKAKELQNLVSQVTTLAKENSLSRSMESFFKTKEKDWDEKATQIAFSPIPSAGINYGEKLNQFTSAMQAIKEDDFTQVRENELAMKKIYLENYDNIWDEFTRVGAINTFRRLIKGEESRIK
jgi:hypothetical protein